MKFKKILGSLLAVVLVLALITACGTVTKTDPPKTDPPKTDSSKTDPKKTDPPKTDPPKTTAEPRVTLSVVSTDAGIARPEGVNVNDNDFVNIAREYANVDLNYEIIAWADYQTRLNLLLAGSKYPDILHTAYNDAVNAVEDKGAFVNLMPYYEKSAIVQKRIDKQDFIDRTKNAKTGEYYYIPISTMGSGYPDGYWIRARYDLLVKYNAGKWPETIDEWIEVARKVKAGNPNANPFSAWCPGTMSFQYQKQFWYAHGVESNMSIDRQADNTYKFNCQNPAYDQAMELHRKLYAEGLLSKTFATNTDYAMLTNDVNNNDLLVWCDRTQQMPIPDPRNKEKTNQIWICAPLLKTYPVDRAKAMERNMKFNTFDAGHRVHISKSCKYPDRAWRFIEGLCTDEIYDRIFWGVEGTHYTVNKDGSRKVDAEKYTNISQTWGCVYAYILGYGHSRESNLQILKGLAEKDAEFLGYINMHEENRKAVGAESYRIPFINLGDLLPDSVSQKRDEAQGVMTGMQIKYIMGQLTRAAYDAERTKFLETYGYFLDEYTKAYKARYIDKVK